MLATIVCGGMMLLIAIIVYFLIAYDKASEDFEGSHLDR